MKAQCYSREKQPPLHLQRRKKHPRETQMSTLIYWTLSGTIFFFWKHKMKPSRCLMFDAIKAFWTNCQCHCDQNAKQRKKNVDTKRKKQLKEKTYEVFNYLPLIPWRTVKNVTTQRQPQWSYTIETVPKAPNSRTAEATSMVTQLQRYSTTVKLSGTTHRPQYGD